MAKEFYIASSLGLSFIEFIFDYNDYEINPLYTSQGREEILSLKNNTGVNVISICADFFMKAPIHVLDNDNSYKSLNILKKLISFSEELNIQIIVLPCVDSASIKNEKKEIGFMRYCPQLLKK